MPPRIGERFSNRWEVFDIRSGGMGHVYILLDRKSGEKVAAKTYGDFHLGKEARAQFRQEALAWIDLGRHPNIVQALMIEEIHGKTYVLMEYAVGGSLADWIGTPLAESPGRVLEIAAGFCAGMMHAARRGLIAHSDIKPANWLFDESMTSKVSDFGIATTIRGERLGATAHGTPPYMAPELFEGATANAASDVYSFGVTLFQILSGEVPYHADSWDQFARLHRQAQSLALHKIPRELRDLLDSCLAKAATTRIQTFAALRLRIDAEYQRLTGRNMPVTVPVELSRDQLEEDPEHPNSNWFRVRSASSETPNHEATVFYAEPREAASNTAISLSRLGHHEAAMRLHDAAVRSAPTNATVMLNKSATLIRMGKLTEAAKGVADALAGDESLAAAWAQKGAIALRQMDSIAALAALDRAIELDPQIAEAWLAKGGALARLGRSPEALEAFSRAASINPDSGAAAQMNDVGSDLYKADRSEEAWQYFLRATAVDPNNSEIWYNRGLVEHRLGRHDDAVQSVNRALQLNQSHVDAWVLKGHRLVEEERFTYAEACYVRALTLNSEHVAARFGRAWVCLKTGRTEEAQKEIVGVSWREERGPMTLSLCELCFLALGQDNELHECRQIITAVNGRR